MAVLIDENSKAICQGHTGLQRLYNPEHLADGLKDGAQKIVKAAKG